MAKKIRKLFRRLGENRTLLLGVVFLAMFAVLIGRLFILQVVHGEEYADNFELQITKTRTLDSTRGNIYDRNGKLIAGNKVSYSVTIEDNGTYNTTKERILSLNAELYRLCKLIRANGDSIDTSTFPIEVDENGAFVFTGEEGTTRDRFRADIYGQKKIDDMTAEQKSSSAETLMTFLAGPDGFGLDAYSDDEKYAYSAKDFEEYGLPYQTDESGNAVLSLSNQERLEILVIRYKMKQTNYQKYVRVTVASGVSSNTTASIAENEDVLQGVSISEDSERVYYDGKYFSSLIGYTGQASSDELTELNEELKSQGKEETYSTESIVGKSGLEQYMETILQGTDGSEEIIVNNVGKELETVEGSLVEPKQGNNVYLSIDYDLQIAVYKILEQRIAGILKQYLSDVKSVDTSTLANTDAVPIPIYDVYNALIENSTIDISHFSAADATEREQRIYALFQQKLQQVLAEITQELTDEMMNINSMMEDLKESNNAIVDSISQLSAASHQIAASTEEASEITGSNQTSSKQARDMLEQVLGYSHQLDKYMK